MQVISFCINAKMAHFRKYFSNSTALSHYVPPVTTVYGIIAGLLGYERDTYYEVFNLDTCKIAIIPLQAMKKITQTLNILKVEQINHLCGYGANRTQNNTEFVIPDNIRTNNLSYQIIFAHKDAAIMQKLAQKICHEELGYGSSGISLSIGSAQCLGWISQGRVTDIKSIAPDPEGEYIEGLVPVAYVDRILLDANNTYLSREESIVEFRSGGERRRKITERSRVQLLLNSRCKAMKLCIKPDCTVQVLDDKQKFVFVR